MIVVVMMVDFKARLAQERAKKALEQKLRNIKDGATLILNPWARKAMKTEKLEEPPPPDLREIDMPAVDRTKLSRLISRHVAIGCEEAALKAEKKQLTEAIKVMCKDYSLEKFMVGDTRSAYYKQTRATIKKELLLAANVSPKVIAACTEIKETW